MEIKEYIESGVLEAFVIGSASEQEAQEVLRYKEQYPEIQNALNEIEVDMERVAQYMAVPPPSKIWAKIEERIDGLVVSPGLKPDKKAEEQYRQNNDTNNQQQFIEVEGSSSHIRIHKIWRWVFAAVFVLGKIFLAFAIYYYLENRQAKEQIQELKTELKIRR